MSASAERVVRDVLSGDCVGLRKYRSPGIKCREMIRVVLAGEAYDGGSANYDCDTLTCFTAGRGGSVTGTQSALLILTAALTSSWLIVSPASARRIIGSLTSPGESISSRAAPKSKSAKFADLS